jgi:hypothetical protein
MGQNLGWSGPCARKRIEDGGKIRGARPVLGRNEDSVQAR